MILIRRRFKETLKGGKVKMQSFDCGFGNRTFGNRTAMVNFRKEWRKRLLFEY